MVFPALLNAKSRTSGATNVHEVNFKVWDHLSLLG